MRLFLALSALCVFVLVCASPALAQGPSRRPYRGLFGSGYGETTEMLRASGSAGAAYLSEVTEDAQDRLGNRTFRREGAQFSGALSYGRQGNWYTLTGLAATHYSPNSPSNFVPIGAGAASIRKSLGNRVSASANAAVLYRPHWYGSFLPGVNDSSDEDMMPSGERSPGRRLLLGDIEDVEPVPATLEDDIRESEWNLASDSPGYVLYTTGASLSHRFSNRTAYSVHYGYRMTPGWTPTAGFERQSVGADLHHALGKGLTVRAGYAYGRSHRGSGQAHDHYAIDAGVGYRRALSISRRTTLSFATGSFGRESKGVTRFRMTGNATVNHELGQSWSVAGSIGRSVLLYEAYDEPVVRDGLSVRVHGLLTRRVNVSASASTGLGSIGFENGAPAFHAVHATASAGIAINQFTRASIVYSYYMHRFDQGTVMPDNSPLMLDRYAVRALVNVWAPLFSRAGRGNASR